MEEHALLANDDFDSVATAVYQAIDDSPSQRMDCEAVQPMLENAEVNADDEETYDEDETSRHELDKRSKSSLTNDYRNSSLDHHKSVVDDDKDEDADNDEDGDEDDDEDDVDDNDNDNDDADATSETVAEAVKPRVNCILSVNRRQHTMSHDEDDDEDLDSASLEHLGFEEPDEGDHTDLTQHHKTAIVAQRNKPEPIIIHDKVGMIKKITISNTKSSTPIIENPEIFTPNAVKIKSSTEAAATPDDKLSKQQRSSTPFSREYLALQRSVNDSKILTEFVADASVVKTRKLRRKQLIRRGIINTTPTSTDHSYSSKRFRTNPKPTDIDDVLRIMDKTKRQHNKRYVALKEEAAVNTSSQTTDIITDKLTRLSSRSRSMYNNYSDHSDISSTNSKKRSNSVLKYDSDTSTNSVLNKWPLDVNAAATGSGGSFKRTNMRSENSEFVQKQKEFLQQVINSTQDTPQRRSRSRSHGIDSLGVSSIQQKTPKSKERLSKRFRGDLVVEPPDEGNQTLFQSITSVSSSTINEPPDDSSVNTSNNSASVANTSGEVDNNTENLELYIKNVLKSPPKNGSDSFCWKCHETKVNLACSRCIRSYHASCAKFKEDDNMWICPDCITLDNVLNSTKRSRRNELPLDLLSQLLSFALKRMRYAKGHYSFRMPYEEENAYKKIIVNPVTFDSLQAKIEAKEYRCADELVNDTKWMVHNANILDFGNSQKTVSSTKAILKICRQEANEIETCAECYLNANTRTDWFVDVCSQPHILLWAKLKGFPYWPAKAMGFGPHSLINVKFFGEHDRAFVPVKDCYLYSVQDPNTQTGKRAAKELAECIKEVGEHIERIITKVGGFSYAPYKTPYDPTDEMRQLEDMMPGVQEFIKRQQATGTGSKPSLQFKIYKTADNNLSIIQKDVGSTGGEISTTQQQQDGDDLVAVGAQKKKKGFTPPPAVAEEKNTDNIVAVPAAKYEVISKVSSDDSTCSKISTVILKRKSTSGSGGEVKKTVLEDECHVLGLPKLPRIDDKIAEPSSTSSSSYHTMKRKSDMGCTEKTKVKHCKPLELKIPVFSVKTISINKEVNIASTDVNKSSPKEASHNVNLPKPQLDDTGGASQKVVESLVKNKQGVTIKKIAKLMSPPTTTATTTTAAITTTCISSNLPPVTTQTQVVASVINKTKYDMGNPPPKSVEDKQTTTDSTVVKSKTVDQKQRDEVNNILKGLKPFVEVKKEVLSDKEDDEQDASAMAMPKAKTMTTTATATLTATTMKTTTTTTMEKANAKLSDIPTTNAQTMATPNTTCSKDIPSNNKIYLAKENTNDNLLLHVKDEVFSDEEDALLTPEVLDSGQAVKSVAVKNVNDVRLVGDTIIQKLSSKNGTGQHSNSANANTYKRSSLKGVPYGPLPASALAMTNMQSQHSDAAGISPRAKKSSPQIPPSTDTRLTSTCGNNNPATPSLTVKSPGALGIVNQNMDGNKRPLSRTTMVAIPVDFAGTSQNAISIASMVSSCPVPPLTAVSKMSSAGSAYNSMAHNAPVTVTVSGTSGSLTTPTVVSLNSTNTAPITPIPVSLICTSMSSSTSTVAARKSPISSALTSTALSTSSSLSAAARKSPITAVTYINKPAGPTAAVAIATQNHKNALTMSTPPPLAGLSGSSLSNSTLANVTTTTTRETTTSPITIASTTSNATGCQTESCNDTSQLLSGGLVMPTLATTTDIINRGPPKLASRPRGPLQSDGYPLFASQAGPVSKLFVENAHKISDYFISVMEDTMSDIAQGSEGSLQARVVLLEKEMERTKQYYEQQMTELRRNSENEKTRLVNEIRKQCEAERIRSVEETKRKQWCAQCRREANFYCCWNTSYCGYPCQQLHWSKHATNCAQTRTTVMETTSSSLGPTTTHERHQSKSNNSSTKINTPANYNAKSSIASSSSASLSMSHTKKEKTLIKGPASNNMMASSSATAASSQLPAAARSSNAAQSAELLKLPTNTYLRPVGSTALNAHTLRCNTTYSIPVQRFNVPLPITTHANTGGPQTFTIVRQGNGWSGPVHIANTATNSTIAAPIASVPQQGPATHHRSGGGPVLAANKSTKTQIRYH